MSKDKKKKEETEDTKDKKKTEEDLIEELKEEIQELKAKIEKANDKRIRTMAEFENFRKRNQKERSQWIKNSNKELINEFIDVLENMELAQRSSRDDKISKDHKKGFDMVYKQFADILSKHGVKKIETVGEEFNPKLHEALIFTENDDYEENIIFDCISNGYFLNEQVLRHAKVAVSKGTNKEKNDNDEDETKKDDKKNK